MYYLLTDFVHTVHCFKKRITVYKTDISVTTGYVKR